jgi:hypothetical protein
MKIFFKIVHNAFYFRLFEISLKLKISKMNESEMEILGIRLPDGRTPIRTI